MTDLKKGILISSLAHLLFIGVGFLIYYEMIPEQLLRQIEIIDFSINRAPSRVTDYRPVSRAGEPSVRDFSQGHRSNQAPQRVELPPAHEFDNPLERIEIPLHQDIATTPIKLDDNIGNTAARVQSSISQDALDLSATRIREQPLALTGDDFFDRINSLISAQSDSPSAYYLEGEIKQRLIEHEVIPEYPAGLQKNATVEIQFNVHPNGRVGEMIVVKKDEPILEELSLNSLAQWRFNPIPQDVIQKGKITFIYQLK